MPVPEPGSSQRGNQWASGARHLARWAVLSGIRARRDAKAGFAAYVRRDLSEASDRFARALDHYRAKNAHSAEAAECLNALARIHHDQGDFGLAASAAQQAWNIARQIRTTRGREETAAALNNLARVDLAQGRQGDALAKFRQAHDLLTGHGHPTLASAVVQQNIGSVHDAMGDTAAALIDYQEALDTIAVLGGPGERRAGCLNNIALIHHQRGEFDSALSLQSEAWELCQHAHLVAEGATVLLNMGQILIDRGDHSEGVRRMEAALRIREAIAARSLAVASAHERLAWAYLVTGRVSDADVQAQDSVGLESELAPGSAGHATSLATAFTGPDNTAWQVRDAASRYRIQHWATHSLLDEMDPDFSGLVVSPPAGQVPGSGPLDDLVTVHDLAQLSLHADLVVCSACQTGLGAVRAGEGTIGMSRALLSAGARCVVLSLWPVPDRPTRRLMLAFYQALRRGEPPAGALRTAKAEVRRRYPRIYQSPFAWAAFVVIGDGRAPAGPGGLVQALPGKVP